MSYFEDLYNNCAEKTKLKFLEDKIRHNIPLQTEFLAYLKSERSPVTPVSSENFNKIVNKVREKYKNLFEEVDIENPDWDNYHPPYSGYIEESEAYQLASEQEFERIFADFGSDVTDKIISHSFDEVLAMLVGLYEATQDAEVEDDIGSFGDVNEFLLDEHGSVMNTMVDKIKISAVSGKSCGDSIQLFLKYCESEYPGNPHFPACFEPILLAYADKSDQPVLILEIIHKSDVNLQSIPRLMLLLQKKSGNMSEWLRIALERYHENMAVAKELLGYYFTTDKPAFIDIARELFPTNKREWSEFLQRYVTPDFDRNLFVQIFLQLTVNHSSLEYYYKIQKLLTITEFEQLLLMVYGNKPFLVRLLAENKRYDEIKRLVENYPSDWEFLAVIEPILTIYPEFCFENIRSRVSKTLANERGRHIYERIASWLKVMKIIPGLNVEKQSLIQQTYNHKPNLPALRDEMRSAGLI